MRKLLLLIPVLLIGCTALKSQDIELTPDFAEFAKAAAMTWNEAWANGDAAAINNLYADDALILPPGAEPISGKDATLQLWTDFIAEAPGGGITSVEAVAFGDLGYEYGTYVSEDADGGHLDHGKYLTVWKLVDGEWKIYRDTWNSSMWAAMPGESETEAEQ